MDGLIVVAQHDNGTFDTLARSTQCSAPMCGLSCLRSLSNYDAFTSQLVIMD